MQTLFQLKGRCLLLLPFLLIPVTALFGQELDLTGTVTDESGVGLPGVAVQVAGTSAGITTGPDGEFSFNAVEGSGTLVFTLIGFQTQEIPIENRDRIDIVMKPDVEALDEVVVVGYGTQKKRDLTGSITQINADEFIQPSGASFDQMLQGKVAGVQITQTSGSPGGNVNVLIRGVSSITGGNQPLYVVDGFAIGAGGGGSDMSSFGSGTYSSAGMANNVQNRVNPLASINPADIASIEILKDASATAIYGSRGANGVVIITTKRGAAGKPEVSFDVSYGIQQIANKLDLMDARQFAEFTADGRDAAWVYASPDNSAGDPNNVRSSTTQVKPEFRDPSSLMYNTDWQDAIYRSAPVGNYQLAVSGGNEKIKYRISGGYYDQQGIIVTSDYNRFNLRTNIEIQISDRVRAGTYTSGSYAYGTFPNTEGHLGNRPIIGTALASSPTIPIRDENGDYFSELLDPLGVTVENPLFVTDHFSDNRKISELLSNNFVEVAILDNLKLRSSVGVKLGANEIRLWKSSKLGSFGGQTSPATAGVTKGESLNWLNENTLSYQFNIGDHHNFNVLAGFTAQKDSYDRLSAGATDFPTDNVSYLSAGTVNAGTQFVSEWSMLSMISRLNYSYAGKYLFTATFRRDGSSRFGKNKKWGSFPSFSAGYNLSEEPFMQSVTAVDLLKLRAGYGVSGNNQIGNYNHIGLLSTSNYVDNGQLAPGLVPSNMSNYDLTWEKSKQWNLGLDAAFFQNRLTLTADVYRTLKTELLLAVQLPAATGYGSSTQNIGEIENKGIELAISSVNVQNGDFQWSSMLTFNKNSNKVLKLAVDGGRIANSSYHLTQVGQPVSSYYLMNTTGVFLTPEEVAGHPVQHPATQAGDLKFEDVDGDGRITASDKKIVGSPWPDFTWGFNNQFTFKSFSLGVFINGSQGAENYFAAGETMLNSAGVQNQLAMVDDRWKSIEDPGNGVIPRAIRSNHAYGFSSSSRFLFDASYVRIRNINLSYALPQTALSKLRVKGARIFVDVANVHTFTDYPGYDPESSTTGDNIDASGVDYMSFPLARTFTFGFNLTL